MRQKRLVAGTLEDVAVQRKGKVHPREAPELSFLGLEHIEAHTMRVIGQQRFGDLKSAGNRFRSGDVLYARLRPYLNKVVLATGDGACSGEFIVLTPREDISGQLLAYRLNSSDFVDFAKSLNAGDRPRVDWKEISSFPIFLPSSFDDQQLLVAHLDLQLSRLDAAVAALKRAQANLKRNRASVLQAAVTGRLVPTEHDLAQAEGRDYETGVEVATRIQADLDRKKGRKKTVIKIDHTKGETPPGWAWAVLSQLALLENGDRSKAYPQRSEYVDEGIPFINAGHLEGGKIEMHNMNYISEGVFSNLRAGIVQRNDILFCLRGSLGKVACATSIRRGAIASSLIIIRAENNVLRSYLMTYLQSPQVHKQIKEFDNGSAQPNLAGSDLARFVVPLPPLAEQARIVEEVERRLSVADRLEATLEANLRRATRLRQAILKKAFTFEDAEANA